MPSPENHIDQDNYGSDQENFLDPSTVAGAFAAPAPSTEPGRTHGFCDRLFDAEVVGQMLAGAIELCAKFEGGSKGDSGSMDLEAFCFGGGVGSGLGRSVDANVGRRALAAAGQQGD